MKQMWPQMSALHLATSTSRKPDVGSWFVHTNDINNKPFLRDHTEK